VIAVTDYGIGNVSSIVNMLKKIGVEAKLANSP
jgi:imidazoleglycerol phosphate synthase glutamine amidotransferase subunit HisH